MDTSMANRIIAQFKQEYSRLTIDGDEKFIEAITGLLRKQGRPGASVMKFLDDVVMMIQRHYKVREVSIGLKSRQDGTYRYVSFAGFRKDSENALRALVYHDADFQNEQQGKQISQATWLFLTENKAFADGEETTYNRPVMLSKQERQSPTQSLEADYFDTRILDRKNEMIGWIEYSGTIAYQFPSTREIKEIELIASITSLVMQSSMPMH